MLITNIKFLVNVRDTFHKLRGADLAVLPVVEDTWLRIKDGEIDSWGSMSTLHIVGHEEVYDANGGTVLPTWCDSHTHIVFAAPRESEFVDKIRGLSYAEIAAKGGGILNSARKLAATDEEVLFELAKQRIINLIRLGTGALEVKSGYGLRIDAELKMLRVIRRLKEWSPIPIKATFFRSSCHTYGV